MNYCELDQKSLDELEDRMVSVEIGFSGGQNLTLCFLPEDLPSIGSTIEMVDARNGKTFKVNRKVVSVSIVKELSK